jgi:hypothetical protein
MLVLNRSLLNREYTLINVLKDLASIISTYCLHVIFLSMITPRYISLFTNGMFRPFNVRRDFWCYSRYIASALTTHRKSGSIVA